MRRDRPHSSPNRDVAISLRGLDEWDLGSPRCRHANAVHPRPRQRLDPSPGRIRGRSALRGRVAWSEPALAACGRRGADRFPHQPGCGGHGSADTAHVAGCRIRRSACLADC